MSTMTQSNEPRCPYRSPSGRRCRNKCTAGWNMCYKHCDFSRAYAAAAEIVSNRDRLDTAEGIHSMMVRTTLALAARKIPAREASTLFYGGVMMLTSLKQLREERGKVFLRDEDEAWRAKALADSFHDQLNCEDSSEDEGDEEEKGNEQESETAESKNK